MYPDENNIKIILADIYIELEDDERAINILSDIDIDDPTYIQALLQLADLYQAQGLFEVAEQKLLTAKQLEPNEVIIDFALAELLFSTGAYQKAITYYEKVKLKAEEIATISINERLAEAYAATGEYEIALQYFQNIDNENADALFKYGFTASQANRQDIAIKVWEQVIKNDPYYHTVYDQLAKAYEEEELIEEAYKTAKKGLKIDEYNKELYFYAGALAHQLSKNAESESYIREAIALDPDYKEAIMFLIKMLKEKDKFTDIIDLITNIKTAGANDPLYEWELARAFVETESYKNALKHYTEAYNSLNQDSEFLKEYGYFLIEEGRMREAISILESYLIQQPLDMEVEEYLERLKQSNES